MLWERVRNRPGRPLLKVNDPYAALAELHRRRTPIYSEADVVVESRRDSDPWQVARESSRPDREGPNDPGAPILLTGRQGYAEVD